MVTYYIPFHELAPTIEECINFVHSMVLPTRGSEFQHYDTVGTITSTDEHYTLHTHPFLPTFHTASSGKQRRTRRHRAEREVLQL